MLRLNSSRAWLAALLFASVQCGGRTLTSGDDSVDADDGTGGSPGGAPASAGRGCNASSAGANSLESYARLRTAPDLNPKVDRGTGNYPCMQLK